MGDDPQQIDRDLLAIRDRLQLRQEQDNDHRYDWLLKQVKDQISERARQACVEGEPN
jgi:hypothetical protein